jgi:hypothetical protein
VSDREAALRVLAALRATAIGDGAVLVGSSGLFGFRTAVPAITEDVDVAIPEALAATHGDEVVAALAAAGFAHEPGTATFVGRDGTTFDLLGHGDPAAGDHVGGAGLLRVMVFEDLSRIVGEQGAVAALPAGGQALTPAGFVATKLLTERGHKGAKDKLQALLVIAERGDDPAFAREVQRLLAPVEPVRRDDLRASAQEAFLSLAGNREFDDAGAAGYGTSIRDLERGLELLGGWLVETAAGG